MRLAGKAALITGGGTGIGLAVAQKFVSEGAKVVITGRRRDVLEEAAKQFPPGTAAICPGDVSLPEDDRRMIETALALGGRLDILVNNAAFNVQASITELSLDDWQSHLAVNLTGPFMLMKMAIPTMIKGGGGSVINISSLGGLRSVPEKPAYCTTKAGLIMLTQQAALDYGRHNIRCNVVCPGGVETTMTGRTITSLARTLNIDEQSAAALLSEDVPLERMAVPSELSGICLYLASDDASFTTGGVFVIDGGANVVDVGRLAVSRALKNKGA
ncbi:MAG: SDR family oxidoreductase [Syntrophorhabdales bacterium]|jgi:NAD(P)-dependent dehydrogenase (short-subunit alcohol dehydrogenase family)